MSVFSDILNAITTRGRRIQIKMGLAKDFNDSKLKVGELGLIVDKDEVRIGLADGTTKEVGTKLNNTLTSTSTTEGLTAAMGKELKSLIDVVSTEGKLINDKLTQHINDVMLHNGELNQYITNPDSNKIYRTVTFKRTDGTNYMISNLSNPDSNGNYQTLVWEFYASNGTTKILTKTWTMTYDSDGNITSKVVS